MPTYRGRWVVLPAAVSTAATTSARAAAASAAATSAPAAPALSAATALSAAAALTAPASATPATSTSAAATSARAACTAGHHGIGSGIKRVILRPAESVKNRHHDKGYTHKQEGVLGCVLPGLLTPEPSEGGQHGGTFSWVRGDTPKSVKTTGKN